MTDRHDIYSAIPIPKLSPEEREIRDPKTFLQLTIDESGQIDQMKPWEKKVIPIHSMFQLLKDSGTGQLALIAWPKDEFESEKIVEEDYTEFKEPKGYRTSYGQFEEIGLYSSLKDVNERIRAVNVNFDPLVEMQDSIDTRFREDDIEEKETKNGNNMSR